MEINENLLQLGSITTSKYGAKSISSLNNQIKGYIESVYGKYGFIYQGGNKDIDIDGFILNTEYIDKMVNNYTIFKKIIELNGLKDEDEF